MPIRGSPPTITVCQSSSSSATVPPSRLAQKLLSAVRSAASNTMICRLICIASWCHGAPTTRRESLAGTVELVLRRIQPDGDYRLGRVRRAIDQVRQLLALRRPELAQDEIG